ncbi:hypothetical protein Pmani_020238 [Petrolisthes manimaculis]|uniref:Uncharacterized protein n=1 Tax=Petrolisthes manimaculis TaxID=1843537 RepID=A0AAE1PH95_9EUCA|nr:hypothetical protein Pmani_020238 [Petrolisthes manimaculis]
MGSGSVLGTGQGQGLGLGLETKFKGLQPVWVRFGLGWVGAAWGEGWHGVSSSHHRLRLPPHPPTPPPPPPRTPGTTPRRRSEGLDGTVACPHVLTRSSSHTLYMNLD